MRALFKTLFGDRNTLTATGLVLVVEAVLAGLHAFPIGALVMPIAVLGAVGWLARR